MPTQEETDSTRAVTREDIKIIGRAVTREDIKIIGEDIKIIVENLEKKIDTIITKTENMIRQGEHFLSRPLPPLPTGRTANEQLGIMEYELDGRSIGGAMVRRSSTMVTGRNSREEPYRGVQTYHTDNNGRILPD